MPHQAWLAKDAATVEHLMADDYVYVAPNGSVFDRQAIPGILRSPSYRLDAGRVLDRLKALPSRMTTGVS
jgi:hypothetical protein